MPLAKRRASPPPAPAAAPQDNNQARLANLLKQLSPEQVATLPEVAARVQSEASVWADGVEPMSFDQFCVTIDPNSPLFPRQHKVFSECGWLRASDIIKRSGRVQEVVLVYGKGAGKDFVCARLVAYITFVLLNLKDDPATYFGLAYSSRLSIINIAPTQDQARRVFFEQYLKPILLHPLFASFIEKPKDQILTDSASFYRYTQYGVRYTTVGIFSMTSSGTGLEGHNVFTWVMDEADDFRDTAEASNAERLHEILRTSAETRFGSSWLGMAISYPRVEGGFMLRLIERAKKEKLLMGDRCIFHWDLAASWDVNPHIDRNSPGIQSEYANNPEHARALFECQPPAQVDAFIQFPENIERAVNPDLLPVCEFREELMELPIRSEAGTLYLVTANLVSASPRPGAQYFLGGDAGHKHDGFALALFSTDRSSDAAKYLCPDCGREPELRQWGDYAQQRSQFIALFSPLIYCGNCSRNPGDFANSYFGNSGVHTCDMTRWWRRAGVVEAEFSPPQGRGDFIIGQSLIGRDELYRNGYQQGGFPGDLTGVTIGAKTEIAGYDVPHVTEAGLLRVMPKHRVHPGEENRPVYFPGMQRLCQDVMQQMNVVKARFDPHQTVQITQGLIETTGGDVGEISFSNPEQLRRARLYREMLYAGKVTLLPNAERDKDMKRLQLLRGIKVDHPADSGKDFFDAEAIAVWLAATSQCSELEFSWL